MKKYWYEAQPGQVSAMRIMAVPGFYAGIIIALAGTAGVLFCSNVNAIHLVWGGLTFSGACMTGKKFQKDKEILINENQ